MIKSEKRLPSDAPLVEVAEDREDYIAGWLALRERWRQIKINRPKRREDADPEKAILRTVR